MDVLPVNQTLWFVVRFSPEPLLLPKSTTNVGREIYHRSETALKPELSYLFSSSDI